MSSQMGRLGKIVLFGSGETSATGRTIHDRLLAELSPPVTIAILETPAGFQPNSEHVAGEVAEFLKSRLKNYLPQVHIIPARQKGTTWSPDDPDILEPLLDAQYIFLGPGSPTYAARNLEGTLALQYLLAKHQEGSTLCFASAATLAVGAKVLPVYEIFKAGSDLYWADGLDILAVFGLELAIVPHWNNNEGGAHLDTSCCFMGRERFERLRQLLPPSTVILAIDEHTAAIFDLQQGHALILGKGTATIVHQGRETVYPSGQTFPLAALGPYRLPDSLPAFILPVRVAAATAPPRPISLALEAERLIERREEARRAGDWARADALRHEIAAMGIELQDTKEGPRWLFKDS